MTTVAQKCQSSAIYCKRDSELERMNFIICQLCLNSFIIKGTKKIIMAYRESGEHSLVMKIKKTECQVFKHLQSIISVRFIGPLNLTEQKIEAHF